MNNLNVQQVLDDCSTELSHVKSLVDGLGITSSIVPYLTKYALIKASGSIEQAFKTVIADFCSRRSKKQVKRFLRKRIREGSANPSYDNMCGFLDSFDKNWQVDFKAKVGSEPNKAVLLNSLQSLVDARNEFAHGGSPKASISDILDYFDHARRLIEIMDDIVS